MSYLNTKQPKAAVPGKGNGSKLTRQNSCVWQDPSLTWPLTLSGLALAGVLSFPNRLGSLGEEGPRGTELFSKHQK